MTAEAQEARRAYKRAWAKQNPEKVRAHQRRYWERQAEKWRQAREEEKKNGGKNE